MRLDHLGRELDPDGGVPLSLQVACALAGAIQRGELRPGEALPGTRPLAETLGVSRYAVLGALQELEMEGFLVLRQGSGAFVADRPPAARSGPAPAGGAASAPAFDLASQLLPISALGGAAYDLSEGFPDPRLAPQDSLARAYQRALKRHGDQLLGVGEPKGNTTLRAELSRFLRAHRGLDVDPDRILVTRGLRNGLDLALDALFPRGGRLAIEVPRTWDLLETAARHRRLEVVGVAGGPDGLDRGRLEGMAAGPPLRALLLRNDPGADAAAQAGRRSLLALAAAQRFALLEDDSAFPFGEGALPPLPLAAEDRGGSVVYLLSFGRLLAPGIRLGLVAGPRALVDGLARLRRSAELQGDRVLEWAFADLLRDGDLDRHLRRAAHTYSERAARFAAGVRERLGARLEVGRRDGLRLWVEARPGFDLVRWAATCRERGVRLPSDPGNSGCGAPGRLALGFAAFDDPEQVQVLDLLEQAARSG